jgi:hypothetical protein
MNRKQYVTIWITAIMVVVLLGLKIGEIYKWSDITPSGPNVGHSALFSVWNSSPFFGECWIFSFYSVVW